MSSQNSATDNHSRIIYYFELASSALLLAYTLYVIYGEYSSPGQTHYALSRLCQKIAYIFGRLGLAAENRYHHIIETQRMI